MPPHFFSGKLIEHINKICVINQRHKSRDRLQQQHPMSQCIVERSFLRAFQTLPVHLHILFSSSSNNIINI